MISDANNSDENENNMKRAVKEAIEKYYHQLTQGCGAARCSNVNCASNVDFKKLSPNQAAVLAVRLAQQKAQLCEPIKQTTKNNNNNNESTPAFDYEHYDEDDDDDVIVPSASQSTTNLRQLTDSSTSKSMNDALKEAVNYVNEMSKSAGDRAGETKRPAKLLYLTENRVRKIIAKAHASLNEHTRMDVDQQHDTHDYTLTHFKPLIGVVSSVFQNYKSLAVSFRFKKEQLQTAPATTMPCSEPFNIDFDSVRRSMSLLFGGSLTSDETVVQELERAVDLAVYALCVSIRMLLKKGTDDSAELNEILASLLIVNELPLLEEPQYLTRSAKIFYATINELPDKGAARIVRLWSKWHTNELNTYLNKIQQYITVSVISKYMDEENAKSRRRNDPENEDDDDEDELNENEKVCLHNSEGVEGAVSYLRLIYYASLMGGRLDPVEQIKAERQIETDDYAHFQSNLDIEEQDYFTDSASLSTYGVDALEKELDLRPIDCRRPKIPLDQFVNEVANQYIDIQHDYIEYTKHLQNLQLENNSSALRAATSSSSSSAAGRAKKKVFSFLSNPFFLVLSKKNLGLYYDNKIKMMRERRNHIMMSLLEGRIPTPYFKMRLVRQNLLSEALNLIELQEQENPTTLRKQLFIEFENEQGIDQGGVSKEFFQLIIDELLNKGYTFFAFDEKSKYYWLTPTTLETPKEFRLVGILFGIAIYNNVLLDVQFPPVFFRKLMGKLGTLEDLSISHPDLYSSFNSLLEFQGTDEEFEETFMLTFQISIKDNFDTVVSFNLKEDGEKIPVTKQNRKEFVELYADFILNKGIEESFKAFKRGFMKIVMNSPLMRWYTPEELEILLCGTKVMDWKSLESSTSYDSGFDFGHKYIKEFWQVFNEFTDEEKKLFLKFTTGTDRCPHGGLSELKLTIARNGPDTEKLPTAHTCFNVLLLPEYSSRQKLKEKILKAIQYSRGFGLS